MAVDTASKRLSILFGETLPVPSGSFDAGDRLHLLGLYSGFGGEEPEPPDSTFSEWFVSPERQSAGDWDYLTVE